MANVSKTFTYKLPDDYTLQTNDNDSSGTYTYKGPRYWELGLSNNNIQTATPLVEIGVTTTLAEYLVDNPDITVVDANTHPLLVSIFHAHGDSDDTIDGNLGYRTKTGPDGVTYSNPHPVPPWKAYEASELEWDPITNNLKQPLPWHKPWLTWTDVNRQASSLSTMAQNRLDELNAIESPTDSDTALITEWTNWKSEVDNKVSTWSAAGFMPHEIVFSQEPEHVENTPPSEDENPDSA
jgi:hypothetical protein